MKKLKQHRNKAHKALDELRENIEDVMAGAPFHPIDQEELKTTLTAALALVMIEDGATMPVEAMSIVSMLTELMLFRKQFGGALPETAAKDEVIQ